MADEKEKEEETTQKFPFDMKIFIIFGVVIVLAVGLTTFMVVKFLAPSTPVATQAQVDNSTASGKVIDVGDDIVTNLADKDESKYIKFKLALEITDDKLAADTAKVKELQAPIRHAVLSILVKKTSQDVKGVEGFNKLTKELQEELNKKVFKGILKQVYILDFVVQ